MKRSKTIFLFVFVITSFVKTQAQVSPYVESALFAVINNTTFKATSLRPAQLTLPIPVHTESSATNLTVSPRFRVSKSNIIQSNWYTASGWTSGGVVQNTGCNQYNEDGTGWRLPTQRELYIIYLSRKSLGALSGFTALGNQYWTGTQDSQNSGNVWMMDFSTGFMSSVPKSGTYYTRCVRDL